MEMYSNYCYEEEDREQYVKENNFCLHKKRLFCMWACVKWKHENV